MLIFSTGDLHLDVHSRWDETLKILWWMVEEARERKPDLFLIGGDLYERLSVPEERAAMAEWLTAMADICHVIAVRGNHDRQKDCAIMGRLLTTHPIIVEEAAGVHYVAGAAIACLAWPKKAEVLARLQGTGDVNQTAHQMLQNVIRGLGDGMAKHKGPKILLAHAMARGSKVSTGQELVGADFELGLEDLALARADMVVLGHIHMSQEFEFGGVPIIYTGSPRRANFGEPEEKSVVSAWLPDEGGAPCTDWHRIPTPATPMRLLETEYKDGDILPNYESVHGAEIRLRYHVNADQRDAAKARAENFKAIILERGAISCKVEEVVNPTTKARAPAVAEAQGIEAKLQAYWESKGVSLDTLRKGRLLDKVRLLENEVERETA